MIFYKQLIHKVDIELFLHETTLVGNKI